MSLILNQNSQHRRLLKVRHRESQKKISNKYREHRLFTRMSRVPSPPPSPTIQNQHITLSASPIQIPQKNSTACGILHSTSSFRFGVVYPCRDIPFLPVHSKRTHKIIFWQGCINRLWMMLPKVCLIVDFIRFADDKWPEMIFFLLSLQMGIFILYVRI